MLLAASSVAAVGVAARADEVRDAREQVERLESEVTKVRVQYDALVKQVDQTRTDLDEKQSQIVNNTIELNRKQDLLNRKSIELNERLRVAYKAGPQDPVSLFLSASSLAEFTASSRYLAAKLESDRQIVEEVRAEQDSLAYLGDQLEATRDQVQSKLGDLADLLDQTQEMLANSETALAASQADLKVREELKRALDLINRGSTGGSRTISERHKRATENQTTLLKKYPFGPVSGTPPGLRATGETVTGIASWYGPGFNGLPTASGAIYDENLYTCASKELPLGTILIVTFRSSSVLVLVNDRGPYVAGRVLDLSRAAKDAIGMGGLGYVTAQVLEPI